MKQLAHYIDKEVQTYTNIISFIQNNDQIKGKGNKL